MKITVKCPNCFQQVSNDNRFCVFCGYDLSAATPAEPDTPSVTPAPEPPAPEPAVYDGPRFCPREQRSRTGTISSGAGPTRCN